MGPGLAGARRRLLILVLVLSVLVGAAVGTFAQYQGSRGGLHARAGRLAGVELTAAGADDVSTYWTVRLHSTSGLAPPR